jgi:glutamine synthetase
MSIITERPKSPLKSFGFADEEEVLQTVLEPAHKIEFIRVIFPDILGRPMDFSFPSGELDKAFSDGKGFDGSSVEGFVRIEESDLIIKPDPKTFRLLPWTYQGFSPETTWREGVMFGDIMTPDQAAYEGDSRHILKEALGKARADFGIDAFNVGPEMEFFIFPNDREAQPLDDGGYFFSGRHGEIRKEIQILLKRMGILSEYDHHEVATSQHEIDFRYNGALEMADTVMLVRYMVKRVARMHGLYATFMPKPINGQNGSGMHVHQSLWSNGKNLFFDEFGPYHLSEMARSYIGGLAHHARELSAVYSQWINSYKRLIEGYEAPVYIAWGQKNRSAYIRVPRYQPGQEDATRIELRSPDPGCNIYLALATMLTAGLDGVRNRYPLPDPVEENIYEMSGTKQKKFGIQTLPRNLEEAVHLLEKSETARTVLGDHMHSQFIANKREEIAEYGKNASAEFDKQVSDYEIRRYLPIL